MENKEIVDWLNSENFLVQIIDRDFGLVEKGRFFDIESIYYEYNKIYNLKNSIEEVTAIFAIEPTENQKSMLAAKVEKMTGKKVKIFVKVDKTILGGGIIKIGDKNG